jgi:hypothetical protein
MVTEYMPPGVRNWLAMVIVELAPAEPGWTVTGEKLQVAEFGTPAQDKETAYGYAPP